MICLALQVNGKYFVIIFVKTEKVLLMLTTDSKKEILQN